MKRILPPALFALFVVLMGASNRLIDPSQLIKAPYHFTGILGVLCGLGLAIVGKKLFIKLKTNIMTFDDPDKLITQGVFKYSRNPMYLGFVIALTGFAILFGLSYSSLALVVIFVVITDRWYIAFEERKMHEKFSCDYQRYCEQVRRWI